jgi:hypothetical protein
MLLTLAIGAILAQPLAMPQETLKLRVGIGLGTGWEKIRSGSNNRESFRELLADLLRKDGRFEVVLLKPNLGSLGAQDTAHLAADLFIEPIVFSAKQETQRQRVPNALERLAGGVASGSVATSTAEVELRLKGSLSPDGAELFELKGMGKHTATAIDAYNRDTGHVDIGDLRKTDSGAAVERAAVEALKGMPKDLSKVNWKAVVAAVDGNRVVINRGKAAGLKPAMTLRVMVQSEPLRDPVTGQVLAEGEEREIARLRVVKVDEMATTCEVVSGTGIAVLNIVRQ